jgi:hypothetical protein
MTHELTMVLGGTGKTLPSRGAAAHGAGRPDPDGLPVGQPAVRLERRGHVGPRAAAACARPT